MAIANTIIDTLKTYKSTGGISYPDRCEFPIRGGGEEDRGLSDVGALNGFALGVALGGGDR